MRTLDLGVVLALASVGYGQQPASASFRYVPGDVLVAVEHTVQRETDPRRGFALTASHTTERRYTVLAVDGDGNADVLVEVCTGPRQLHEYVVKGKDDRAAYLKKGFEPDAVAAHRVMRATFTPTRFRCEPARDEPAVYYLQELPELLRWALTLPDDDRAQWTVEPGLPRLQATLRCRRAGDEVRGEIGLAIRDPRLRDGAEVACPQGSLHWQRDAATGLPRRWRVDLNYPRHPVGRPNERIVSGELVKSTPLDTTALAQLRADWEAFAAVRDDFFAGRFPAARQAAEDFLAGRPQSLLAAAVQRELDAFAALVPRFGQRPPALAVGHWLGGAPDTLEALHGQVVVLDFWATWCVPCVAGMPHLGELQREYGGASLRVLGLTREDRRQSAADVRRFHATDYAARHDGRAVGYPLVVLADDATHDWFGVRAIPVLVVLDRDGRVYWQQVGSGGQARLERVLHSLLQNGK